MESDFWEEVSFVQSARNREKVLNILVDAGRPMTPTELGDRMGIVVKSASRAVRQLAEHGLVECVNPEAARDRRYRSTVKGREVWERVEEVEEQAREMDSAVAEFAEPSLEYRAGKENLEEDVSYVRLSSNRRKAIAVLGSSKVPLTPTELGQEIGTGFNSASRAVRQLSEHGLARCVNPESVKYRRYELTEEGEEVYQILSGR